MEFENSGHLFNAYKKALKEHGIMFEEDLCFLFDACSKIYELDKSVRPYISYLKMDSFQMMWAILYFGMRDGIKRITSLIVEYISYLEAFEYYDKNDISQSFKIKNEELMTEEESMYFNLFYELAEFKSEVSKKECKYPFLVPSDKWNIPNEYYKKVLKEYRKIEKKSGIFLLYDAKDKLLRIDKSKNLMVDIMSALHEYGGLSFKYAELPYHDCEIMKAYLVSTLKPICNNSEKESTNYSLPYPKFSEKICAANKQKVKGEI